ncbi:hypothetical protein P9314_05185 [Paenibacillus validus]|uniref:hypothetical protein n=1 Tax=Paenibacillus validus TaxID=44253 RepID=UPI000FDA1307|nr:hypothetical protein [Paenibacillus validus]MED4600103.1 hypothetical protein [Paenibacillus validus]MED4605551.1 hypothetical protein [Paenibacillus validus]
MIDWYIKSADDEANCPACKGNLTLLRKDTSLWECECGYSDNGMSKRIDVCSRCGRDIYEGDEVWYEYVEGEPPFIESEEIATCGVCEKEESRKYNESK